MQYNLQPVKRSGVYIEGVAQNSIFGQNKDALFNFGSIDKNLTITICLEE